jgi:hypothetical protein
LNEGPVTIFVPAHALQRARSAASHGAVAIGLAIDAAQEADHHQAEGQALGIILRQMSHPVNQLSPAFAAGFSQT